MYNTEKNFNRLMNGQSTFFLDKKDVMLLKGKLRRDEYKIYYPYPDSEKVIFYNKSIPEVLLYEIKSTTPLRHQDILGTMYSLQISNEMFGDIILDNGRYFIYIMKLFQNYFETNFTSIRNSSIELVELDIDYLSNYERKYEENNIIVSSLRIDTVIARIIKTNRESVCDKIKNKEVILNYEVLNKNTYLLKENDIFSIRKYGKYKFIEVVKTTKKDNIVIKYLKYI